MSPLLVPCERVRLCPEGVGTWGQSREIFQSWDTGLGSTVPARKYNLKPTPNGNVAVVFQDAGDASMIDQLLGPMAVQPEKPLALRYCSSIKSFCADGCFASSRDKSCLTHVKPRRAQERTAEKLLLCEQQAATKRTHAELELRTSGDDESWLFDDILAPACPFDDEDGISVQSLSDICEPMYGMQRDHSEATLESLLNGHAGHRPESAFQPNDSDATVAAAPAEASTAFSAAEADSRQQKALQALWNEGADSTNIMSSLGGLLGDELAGAAPAPALADPANELWAASAVDVLDETFKSFSRSLVRNDPPAKPKPKLGRPPLGPKQSKPAKGPGPVPTTPSPSTKPSTPIAKGKGGPTPKMQNMKMSTLQQQQCAPKPPASQKGKCVWKQLVTYW